MVFAEQGSDWVPDTLQMMDNMYDRMFRHEQERLKSRPSEYWRRQCYVQAMFFRASEAKLRHKIGIDNMLWGSDYPHYEGSWPNSRKVIHEALHGVPEDEIRAILGGERGACVRVRPRDARRDRGAMSDPPYDEI